MKKLLLLSLLCITTNLLPRQVETYNPAISCDLRKMNDDEIEDLLFNEEAANFLKSSLRGMDGVEISLHGHTHGHHSSAADTEKMITIKNLHEKFQPFTVTIKNNSERPITIYLGEYINTLAESLTTFKRIVKYYPNFKSAQAGWMVSAVFSGLFASLFGVGTVVGTAGGIPQTITLIIPTVLLSFVCAISAKLSRWAGRLKKRKKKLSKRLPRIYDRYGNKHKTHKSGSITIQPGESFTEELLVSAQSIQTSSAVFGSVARPELVYHS